MEEFLHMMCDIVTTAYSQEIEHILRSYERALVAPPEHITIQHTSPAQVALDRIYTECQKQLKDINHE